MQSGLYHVGTNINDSGTAGKRRSGLGSGVEIESNHVGMNAMGPLRLARGIMHTNCEIKKSSSAHTSTLRLSKYLKECCGAMGPHSGHVCETQSPT